MKLRIIKGPNDGMEIESEVKDHALQMFPTTVGTVEIYWRDGNKLQYIKTITHQEYLDRFAPRGDDDDQRSS